MDIVYVYVCFLIHRMDVVYVCMYTQVNSACIFISVHVFNLKVSA